MGCVEDFVELSSIRPILILSNQVLIAIVFRTLYYHIWAHDDDNGSRGYSYHEQEYERH